MKPSSENPSDPGNANEISGQSRVIMWLFATVFLGFGLVLAWDLIAGLSR